MYKNYILNYTDTKCVEIYDALSSISIYKIPYKALKNKTHRLNISNNFVVYILFGINKEGLDNIYVGKSKNGIDNRPISHEDKFNNWTTCYILTTRAEKTFLNDGTIQYLEHKIRHRVDEIGKYINTTSQTTSGTANTYDQIYCERFLNEAYDMLFTIGLDLFKDDIISENKEIDTTEESVAIHENMKELYDELIKMLKDIYPYVEEDIRKYRTIITAKDNVILKVQSGKSYLEINLNVKLGELNDKENILENVSDKPNRFGSGDYRIFLTSRETLEKLKPIFEQLFDKAEYKEKLYCYSKGELIGEGCMLSNGFIVFKGSKIVDSNNPSFEKYCKHVVNLRKEMITNGLLINNELQNDYIFSSSSMASSFIKGVNTSGPEEWKNEKGIKLKDLK